MLLDRTGECRIDQLPVIGVDGIQKPFVGGLELHRVDLEYPEDLVRPLQVVLESNPEFGSLTLGEDGGFEYIPDDDFSGDDAFVYRVSDGEKLSEIAFVQIQVSPVNVLP